MQRLIWHRKSCQSEVGFDVRLCLPFAVLALALWSQPIAAACPTESLPYLQSSWYIKPGTDWNLGYVCTHSPDYCKPLNTDERLGRRICGNNASFRLMPTVRKVHATVVQGRVQRIHAESMRPPMSAATAKLKGTARPT